MSYGISHFRFTGNHPSFLKKKKKEIKREKGKIQLEVWVCCPDFEQENEHPEENVKVAQGHP